MNACDHADSVDPLLDALGADEVVQRFFVDYTIRGGGALWIALTAHRLLILERKGRRVHVRHLTRPLRAWANPRRGVLGGRRVEVEGADGQRMRCVLDQADVEELLDVETSSKFPRSMSAEPTAQLAPADHARAATHRSPSARSRDRARGKWMQPIDDYWWVATEEYKVPSTVMDAFAQAHPEVPPDALPIVESAFLQWVRIEGRKPGHAQPSVAVDSLWQSFVADETAWSGFTHDVGIALPYRPTQNPPPKREGFDAVLEALASTFWDAVLDEQPLMLPVLLYADEACGIERGNLYQRCCVESPCAEPDRTCFHWSSGMESYAFRDV